MPAFFFSSLDNMVVSCNDSSENEDDGVVGVSEDDGVVGVPEDDGVVGVPEDGGGGGVPEDDEDVGIVCYI